MASKKRTKGACSFCGREMTKGGMLRHLSSCDQRKKMIEEQRADSSINAQLYHLQVYSPYGSDYWLNLELKSTATLDDLDSYLRAIWLECCDHLSQFSSDERYGRELPMQNKIYKVFEEGVEINHVYDFGSSTDTIIKMVDKRRGAPFSSFPIYLMARNNPPEILCDECDKPALWIDTEALYETGDYVLLCTEHAKTDSENDFYEMMPIVNSPRTGVCGYTGPAEPPY